MYQWLFSPVESSLPFALTDCPASYSAAQTQFELRCRLLLQNKAAIVTCVAPLTARAIHLASPVIKKKKKNGRKFYSSHAWSWERRELSMRKFSLWLTYSTCKNARKKTTTTKNQCMSTTQHVALYSENGSNILIRSVCNFSWITFQGTRTFESAVKDKVLNFKSIDIFVSQNLYTDFAFRILYFSLGCMLKDYNTSVRSVMCCFLWIVKHLKEKFYGSLNWYWYIYSTVDCNVLRYVSVAMFWNESKRLWQSPQSMVL